MQRLQIFWRKNNCPITYKIIALDAIVRSKLTYGTDALQLNEPDLKRMEEFHLQAMRRILQWDTTFINRENTNAKIYTEVNKRIQETTTNTNLTRKAQGKKTKKVKQLSPSQNFTRS